MAHGSGGRAMRDLIEEVFVRTFDPQRVVGVGAPEPRLVVGVRAPEPRLAALQDHAQIELEAFARHGDRLALTTDSFVVDPLFFPGGDIGKLAVYGTVNDLAVGGATPMYLTCGVIIEEGLEIEILRRVARSMKEAADDAGVRIITGDTKVVGRGAADKLFINTTGVGVVPRGVQIGAERAKPGDHVLVNGFIGDHGAAIVDARGQFKLTNTIESDCQSLAGLMRVMLAACSDLHAVRDATRGGIAGVLNEFAEESGVAIRLDEPALPLRGEVRGMCELLGLDPLYLANEGKLVAVVPPEASERVLCAMRAHPAGAGSVKIGEVLPAPAGRVTLATCFGGERIVDTPHGEQLPRIC
jgi:hydrogenase expression/formation protein HypE